MAKTVTLDTFRVINLSFQQSAQPQPDGRLVTAMSGQLTYQLIDSTTTPPAVLIERTVNLVDLMDDEQIRRFHIQFNAIVARQVAKEGMAGAKVEF